MLLSRGRYTARFAETPGDVEAAQRLRHRAFVAARPGAEARPGGRESDAFDDVFAHVLVEEERGIPVCCFRVLPCSDGRGVLGGYAAQHYGLDALAAFAEPVLELGRFCIAPDDRADADILRVAWAALTVLVDRHGARMLYGCSSFPGADPDAHAASLALLGQRHVAPEAWRPRATAPRIAYLADLDTRGSDPRQAVRGMPPLLRSYLAMGAGVSDHAVIDTELDTLHVFTGLAVGAIPAARRDAMRATFSG